MDEVLPHEDPAFRRHLMEGVGFECVVCDQRLGVVRTDAKGQLLCGNCYCEYEHLPDGYDRLKDDQLERLGLVHGQVATITTHYFPLMPLFRRYFHDTQNKLPMGRWKWKTDDQYERERWFADWLYDHRQELMGAWGELLAWDTFVLRAKSE